VFAFIGRETIMLILRVAVVSGVCILGVTVVRAQTTADTIALAGVNVIDVESGDVRRNQTIVVSAGSGRIVEIVPGRATKPQHSRIIDGAGKFVIPGLWDMHVHAFNDGRYDYVLPLLLANGITGVRDMGTNLTLEDVQQVIQDVVDGRRPGPRFGAWTGSLIDGDKSTLRFARAVGTGDDVRELVRSYKQRGATFIKPYDLLSPEVYRALAEETKAQGLPFAGHVPFSMTSAQVSDLGQRSIEHTFDLLVSVARNEQTLRATQKAGNPNAMRSREELAAIDNYDEGKAASLFARFVRNRTWQCPTIINLQATTVGALSQLTNSGRLKYIPASVRQDWDTTFIKGFAALGSIEERKKRFEHRVKITGAMHRAGVRLLAGTDAHGPFNVPGFSLHDELELFVRAGLTPLQALQAATLSPARFLERQQDLGTIAPGKVADLVLLDANPLENITHTQRIAAVIAAGRYMDRARLDGLFADAEVSARRFTPRNSRVQPIAGAR
jgi:hypothetical protein